MVIPKMGRPSAGTSRMPLAQPSASLKLANSIAQIASQLPTVENPGKDSDTDLGFLAMGGFPKASRSSLSITVKGAMAGATALVMAGILIFTNADKPKATAKPIAQAAGPAGWITDFAAPGGSQSGRRVSVLRSSLKSTDFLLEFQGKIENKALGWVFRAKDPKNFYVMKLEFVKLLPRPTVVLSRFAVIDGQEQARVQVPLSMPVRLDTIFTVRMEAAGASFTTWIQEEKADQWNDTRLRAGGVGLYSEHGERATLKGDMLVSKLVRK